MSQQVSAVLIPQDESQPLQSILIPKHPNNEEGDLEQMTRGFQHKQTSAAIISRIDMEDIRQKLLIRPSSQGSPGLYAFCVVPAVPDAMKKHPQRPSASSFVLAKTALKNVRATRLAMACGHFSYQLYGTCLLVRTSLSLSEDLEVNDVYGACCISPDLRPSLQQEIQPEELRNENRHPSTSRSIPMTWLGDALQQNYHDASVLSRLATVMTGGAENNEESSDSDSDSDDSTNHQNKSNIISINTPTNDNEVSADPETDFSTTTTSPKQQLVTKQPLCIHCRRPASTLCDGCQACYFCDAPRNCKILGWTHESLCKTWKTYAHRRKELSSFAYLEQWTQDLTTTAFHSSEEPYEQFLRDQLGIETTNDDNDNQARVSWWSTELHGWAGGNSQSAATVDITIRQSYEQGFAPLADIPPQRPVHQIDIDRVGTIQSNDVGLWKLTSWVDYYRLRGIPPSSPVALLCTFPLTVYHGIVCYGEVPCTVARMLKRPLRVHIVGVEKEANFLDLFQEVGFLFPQDFSVCLPCVCRSSEFTRFQVYFLLCVCISPSHTNSFSMLFLFHNE